MLEKAPKGMLGLIRGTVVILDGGCISREGLRHLLGMMAFSVIGVGRTIAEAQADTPFEHPPNLLIHNIGSEAELALPVILDARARLPGARSVVLMDCTRIEAVAAVMRTGVEAVLSNDISTDVLQRSLELVLLNQCMFSAGVTEALMVPLPPASEAGCAGGEIAQLPDAHVATGRRLMLLSKREHQILRCLVYGMSNKLIARELNIAETTVKVHIRGVLRKTRLSNRTQAAIWALNSNFSSSPPAGDGAEGGAAVEHAELELSGSARHWVEGSARSAPSDTKRAHRARSLGVLQADPASTGWRWTRQWDGSQCRS